MSKILEMFGAGGGTTQQQTGLSDAQKLGDNANTSNNQTTGQSWADALGNLANATAQIVHDIQNPRNDTPPPPPAPKEDHTVLYVFAGVIILAIAVYFFTKNK